MGAGMNARLRDLKRSLATVADEHGASVKMSITGGGHIRATFAVDGVRKADIIMASTPSNWRNGRNNEATVRRVLQGMQA
jgi:hypothetical protein